MNNLKPCPFCGRTPGVLKRPSALDGYFCAISCFCGGYSARAHQAAIDADEAEAYEKAAQRWNRRAKPTNKPITLDELREMDGEPVYIVGHPDFSGWAVPWRNAAKYIARCPEEANISYYPKDYGKTWLAYRHKPEGSENNANL